MASPLGTTLPAGFTLDQPAADASSTPALAVPHANSQPLGTSLPAGFTLDQPDAGSDVDGNIGHGSSDQSYLGAGARLLGRTAIRMVGAPTADLPSLAYHLASGGSLSDFEAPTQQLINKLGWQMDPNAGLLMRGADIVAPMINPFGLGEAWAQAPTIAAKLGMIGGRVAGAGAAAAGSELAGAGAKQLGLGDVGQVLASMAGGAAPGALLAGGKAGLVSQAGENAPAVQAAVDRINADRVAAGQSPIQATFGMLADKGGKQFEKVVSNIPGVGYFTNRARTNVEQASRDAINQSNADWHSDPANAPTVDEPAGIGEQGAELRSNAQTVISQLQADQDKLERNIGPATKVDVSVLRAELERMANDETIAPSDQAAIQSRINELQKAMPKPVVLKGQDAVDWLQQNQRTMQPSAAMAMWHYLTTDPDPAITVPGPQTVSYRALKQMRNTLGADMQNMPGISKFNHDAVYDQYTNAMQDAADQAGQGQLFRDANASYAAARQSGLFDIPDMNEAQAVNRMQGAASKNPSEFEALRSALGDQSVTDAMTHIVSGMGQKGDIWDLHKFGNQIGPRGASPLGQHAQDFLAQQDPAAMQRVQDVGTMGRAFQLAPERPGLSKSLMSTVLAEKALSHLGLAKSIALGIPLGMMMQSRPVLNAMAGRGRVTGISDVLGGMSRASQAANLEAGQ